MCSPCYSQKYMFPSEVLRELQAPKLPAIVRQWILQPPTWLKIADPAMQLPSVASIGQG